MKGLGRSRGLRGSSPRPWFGRRRTRGRGSMLGRSFGQSSSSGGPEMFDFGAGLGSAGLTEVRRSCGMRLGGLGHAESERGSEERLAQFRRRGSAPARPIRARGGRNWGRERKRAGGARYFWRGVERRAGLGLLVDWTHGDGQTPATAWRAAATATVELNQGSVSMTGKNSEFEPLFLPKSYCNVSIDQYKS